MSLLMKALRQAEAAKKGAPAAAEPVSKPPAGEPNLSADQPEPRQEVEFRIEEGPEPFLELELEHDPKPQPVASEPESLPVAAAAKPQLDVATEAEPDSNQNSESESTTETPIAPILQSPSAKSRSAEPHPSERQQAKVIFTAKQAHGAKIGAWRRKSRVALIGLTVIALLLASGGVIWRLAGEFGYLATSPLTLAPSVAHRVAENTGATPGPESAIAAGQDISAPEPATADLVMPTAVAPPAWVATGTDLESPPPAVARDHEEREVSEHRVPRLSEKPGGSTAEGPADPTTVGPMTATGVTATPMPEPAPQTQVVSPAPQTGEVRPSQPEPEAAPRIKITRSQTADQLLALQERAYAAWQQGDFAEASALYQQIVQLNPRHRGAILGLAATALRRNDPETAHALYLQLLEYNPQDPLAHAGLLSLAPGGGPVADEARLRRLLADHPHLAPLHLSLGNLHASRRNWPEARQAYQAALQAARRASAGEINPIYHYNLAIALDHLGLRDEARHHYREAQQAAGRSGNSTTVDITALQRRLAELDQAETNQIEPGVTETR